MVTLLLQVRPVLTASAMSTSPYAHSRTHRIVVRRRVHVLVGLDAEVAPKRLRPEEGKYDDIRVDTRQKLYGCVRSVVTVVHNQAEREIGKRTMQMTMP